MHGIKYSPPGKFPPGFTIVLFVDCTAGNRLSFADAGAAGGRLTFGMNNPIT